MGYDIQIFGTKELLLTSNPGIPLVKTFNQGIPLSTVFGEICRAFPLIPISSHEFVGGVMS